MSSNKKKMYAISVDPTADQVNEYTNALNELKKYDCYTHVPGSITPEVNALFAPYLEAESDYNYGHEKVAILSYLERDLLYIATLTGTASNPYITFSSGNPQDLGITFEDEIEAYDSMGYVTFTGKVVRFVNANEIEFQLISGEIPSGSTIYKFFTGTANRQAEKIGQASLEDRRIKVIFPGYFYATYKNVEYLFPSYYIAATRAGMDNAVPVSRSMTRENIAVVGLSNFRLMTTFDKWSRDNLNDIAGGGFDIQMQPSSTSQVFFSRHDVTTDLTVTDSDSVVHKEWSITKQADLCAKTVRKNLDPYISKYSIDSKGNLFKFLSKVVSLTSSTLQKNVINEMKLVSMERDPIQADKINIIVSITVFVPDNYIDVTLLIKSR
jgi:hypothetical protein